MRVAQRLRLTSHSTPEELEADLCRLLPEKSWTRMGRRLVLHGRAMRALRGRLAARNARSTSAARRARREQKAAGKHAPGARRGRWRCVPGPSSAGEAALCPNTSHWKFGPGLARETPRPRRGSPPSTSRGAQKAVRHLRSKPRCRTRIAIEPSVGRLTISTPLGARIARPLKRSSDDQIDSRDQFSSCLLALKTLR